MTGRHHDQMIHRFWISNCISLMLGVALIFLSMLRETPMFWRNAGGFPVILRDLVWLLFYPGLLGLTAACVTHSWLAFARMRQSKSRSLVLSVVIMQWMLWMGVVLIAFWNNISNFIQGLPLHQHPQ